MKYISINTYNVYSNRTKRPHNAPNPNKDNESVKTFANKEIIAIGGSILLMGIGFYLGRLEKKKEAKEAARQTEQKKNAKMDINKQVHEHKMEEMRLQQEFWRERHNAIHSSDNEDDTLNVHTPTPATSFEEMMNAPMFNVDGCVCDRYVPKGSTTFLLGGGSSGKTILMNNILIDGLYQRPASFLPDSAAKPAKTDVLYYCLEPRRTDKVYFPDPKIFPCNFKFVSSKALQNAHNFSQEGIIRDLRYRISTGEIQNDTTVAIDPITKLEGTFNAEKFIAEIDKVKNEASEKGVILTVLISAHTEEIEEWKWLTTTNVAGGDGIIRYADYVIAIRKANPNFGHRFIQILKTKLGYDENVVSVMKFTTEGGYTHFSHVRDLKGEEALPAKVKAVAANTNDNGNEGNPKSTLENEVLRLRNEEGLCNSEIAKRLGTNPMAVSRILKKKGIVAIDGRKRKKS